VSLRDVAERPRSQPGGDVLGLFVDCQENNLRPGMNLTKAGGNLKAGQERHGNVEDDDIGIVKKNFANRLLAICGSSKDSKFAFKFFSKICKDLSIIVGKNNTNCGQSSPRQARTATNRLPCDDRD